MNNMNPLNRRDFLKIAGMGGAASLIAPSFAFSETSKKHDIGATFILWGYSADNLETSLQDMVKLGYHSFETFGHVIEEWEKNRGDLPRLLKSMVYPLFLHSV